MKTEPKAFFPEVKPADCYDWLSAEDAVRHALAAYYVACRLCEPEDGQSFRDEEGTIWSSRGDFFDHLADHFRHRLARHADTVGLQGFNELGAMASRIEAVNPPLQAQIHRC